MIINILGTEYDFTRDNLNNPDLAEADGFCRVYDKQICVRERQYLSGKSEASKIFREEHVIRHEIIHAVAEECGVPYGDNENLVDWIAHIIPIVNKAFEKIREAGD